MRGDWVGNSGDRRVWAKWGKGARHGINSADGVLRSMYVGAEITYLRGGVRRSWGWMGRRTGGGGLARKATDSEMEMEWRGDSGRGSSRERGGIRTSRK